MSEAIKTTFVIWLWLLLFYGISVGLLILASVYYGDVNGHLAYPFWSFSLIPLIFVTAPLRMLGIPGFESVTLFSLPIAIYLFLLTLWCIA